MSDFVRELSSLIERAYSAAVHEQKLLDLAGEVAELEPPYDNMIKELEFAREEIERAIEVATFMRSHICRWNDDDCCIYCGADGRV